MKIVRVLVTVLFVISVGAWGFFQIVDRVIKDTTPPEIYSESDVLELSVKDGEKELLKGLTATDNRDGDITSEILVGTHSKFISEGVCNITYLVFDSSNNVCEYTRRVIYKDYTKPVFTLNHPLMFKAGDTVSMFPFIQLTDCLDGDITSKVKIVVNDIDNSTVGTYNVTFQAANGYADVITRQLPVNIVNDSSDSPQIELTDYLIYVKKGDKFNPEKYIKSVTDKYDEDADIKDVKAVSAVDTRSAGVHQVKYEYTNRKHLTGHTFLTVIVKEG